MLARPDCQRVGGPAAWSRDSGTLASGRPTLVCFKRRNDAADDARRLGRASVACGLDSCGYFSLRNYVRAGFDEGSLSFAEPLRHFAREVLCDECVTVPEGTDPLCLHVCEIEQESGQRGTHCRDA